MSRRSRDRRDKNQHEDQGSFIMELIEKLERESERILNTIPYKTVNSTYKFTDLRYQRVVQNLKN